jgi:hypothetical protein
MSEETLQEITRESSLGYHFINTFQNCPRKWYIKYICGILPTKLGKALLFGKAWHEGMEVFYKGNKDEDQVALADKAHGRILENLRECRTQFRTNEEFDEMYAKASILFQVWYRDIGQFLHRDYEVLMVEQEFRPKLGGAFTMTIRPDAVVRHRATGRIDIPEHKTTSYSIVSQLETVMRNDQATAYIWGLLKTHPEFALNFGGVLLDVCYNRSKITEVKQQTIVRNRATLTEFELSLLGVFLDLANRVRAFDKRPELQPMLFPRNGGACSAFGCEYEGICRNRVEPTMVLGSEYQVDPWSGRAQLLADTEGEHFDYKVFSDAESTDAIQITRDS